MFWQCMLHHPIVRLLNVGGPKKKKIRLDQRILTQLAITHFAIWDFSCSFSLIVHKQWTQCINETSLNTQLKSEANVNCLELTYKPSAKLCQMIMKLFLQVFSKTIMQLNYAMRFLNPKPLQLETPFSCCSYCCNFTLLAHWHNISIYSQFHILMTCHKVKWMCHSGELLPQKWDNLFFEGWSGCFGIKTKIGD